MPGNGRGRQDSPQGGSLPTTDARPVRISALVACRYVPGDEERLLVLSLDSLISLSVPGNALGGNVGFDASWKDFLQFADFLHLPWFASRFDA